MCDNSLTIRSKITMLLVSISVVILSNCIEEERLPYVVTIDADSIRYHSAICGGYVSENAGPPVIAKGICWGISYQFDVLKIEIVTIYLLTVSYSSCS